MLTRVKRKRNEKIVGEHEGREGKEAWVGGCRETTCGV